MKSFKQRNTMTAKPDYASRRKRLAAMLPQDSVAIIPGAPSRYHHGDVAYPWMQYPNFYYFTGFDEPNAQLIITHEGESILFNESRCPEQEQWTGPILGQENAVSVLGVDAAYPNSTWHTFLTSILPRQSSVYVSFAHTREEALWMDILGNMKRKARRGACGPSCLIDLEPLIGELRLFKDDVELSYLQKAVDLSILGHQRVIHACRQARFEYELEAAFRYETLRHGARYLAYDSIVGSGKRACILHYTANNQPLKSGELVLIDAGVSYAHYAADITRTLPISGQFSPEQRLIYDAVYDAQQAGIACIKPGVLWSDIQDHIVMILTSRLVDLGILQGQVDDLIEKKAYAPFYMHSSGHWLGLDVHDVGSYQVSGASRRLEAGMVLTVEPGLYLSEAVLPLKSPWQDIGIRIEDDILVTSTGYEQLTKNLVSRATDIETWMYHERG